MVACFVAGTVRSVVEHTTVLKSWILYVVSQSKVGRNRCFGTAGRSHVTTLRCVTAQKIEDLA
jgi:hypothetical protein